MTPPPKPDMDSCVTASDLVRQFGVWQEKALHQPVYIVRRGRPSLVLASFELMRRLCEPHHAPLPTSDLTLLFDSVREIVVIIDAQGLIRALNRAAQLAFQTTDIVARDHSLLGLLPEPVGRFLIDLGLRAQRAAAIEHAEITIRDRQYHIVLAPCGDGTLLVAADITEDGRAAEWMARQSALVAATDATGVAASARLNLRGYILSNSISMAELAGFAGQALPAVRFTNLFAATSRDALDDAIERSIAEGRALTQAILAAHDGGSTTVRIGFAREDMRGVACGVTAMVVRTDQPENFG